MAMGSGMMSPSAMLLHQWSPSAIHDSSHRLPQQFPLPSSPCCSVSGSTSIDCHKNWAFPTTQTFATSSSKQIKRARVQRCKQRRGVRMMAENEKSSIAGAERIEVIISGAPASGKGTQCELIVERFGLAHISTGQLLRDEVAAGSEFGKTAKEYMDSGNLVPSEIVVAMVEKKLDASHNGWLLDGFPRTLDQAQTLESIKARPQLFILLDVPDDVLVDRVIGRRLDPVTGRIYHLTYSPPETEEIAARLTQRADDTEEKARLRLNTYHSNVSAVIDVYKDVVKRVDGNRPKEKVFAEVAELLAGLHPVEGDTATHSNSATAVNGLSPAAEAVAAAVGTTAGEMEEQAKKQNSPAELSKAARNKTWIGVPTKLNTTPHSKQIRDYFYADVCSAVKNAVEDGIHRLRVQIVIPELNPEMDVYRIGTLLEIMRELAFTFANDGKRVRVCVQGSMGEGIFSGMPLALAGTRYMLDKMDWGEYGAKGTFINIGSVGAKEVFPEDDMFILMAPQNAVGNCIIDNLQAMVEAAGDRPVIIVNPRLKDIPASGGVMQVRGREERMGFVKSFFQCYHFRLLYHSGTQYPILGALRMSYPSKYEVYKRVDTKTKSKEAYLLLPDEFEKEPGSSELGDAFEGRSRIKKAPEGIWGFFAGILG